ncbi:MAG: tyrosine-type recombinase/integrase [Thermoleophilaceae bacterium]
MPIPETEARSAASSTSSVLPTLLARQERPLDQHPAAVYVARLDPGSRDAQRRALETIARLASGGRAGARELDWAALRYPHTAAIRAELARRYAPATVARHLSALRGALGEAVRLGLLEAEACRAACDLAPVRGERLPAGRALGRGELVALFESCRADRRPNGARDAALLAVLFGGGLRRAEAASLDVDDLDPAAASLRVRAGKGGKERLVYLSHGALAALEAWLTLRGPGPGPLIVGVNRGGRLDPALARLTGQGILALLRRRARRAGVGAFSPHDLRRTFIGDLLDAGADLATVQRLAGHAGVQTTARYDRRPEQAKRKAAELLHVPYAA